MRHYDLRSASPAKRMLVVAAIAVATATLVFDLHPHAQTGAPHTSSAAALLPSSSTEGTPGTHDDSLPDTADTLSHERLADEEPAATF